MDAPVIHSISYTLLVSSFQRCMHALGEHSPYCAMCGPLVLSFMNAWIHLPLFILLFVKDLAYLTTVA